MTSTNLNTRNDNGQSSLHLPRLLADHAVLQAGRPVHLWGWASPSEDVSITLLPEGIRVAGTADERGRFDVTFPAQDADKRTGHTLRFSAGEECREIRDVLFGEVFLCSGQSNMELPMDRVKDRYPEEYEDADLPFVRMFKITEHASYDGPLEELQSGAWTPASREALGEFSATAWFYARSLAVRLGRPVGIINATLGGSRISSWMGRDMLKGQDELLAEADRYADREFYLGRVQQNETQAENWYGALDEADLGQSCIDPDKTIPVPGWLKDAGLENFCGCVWMQKKFMLDKEESCRDLKLWLGTMVDRDETYVNETKVGVTEYQYPPRKYPVPKELLREGVNTVTVRLTVEHGQGRITPGKDYCLFDAAFVTPEKARAAGAACIDLTGDWSFGIGAVCGEAPETDFVNWKPTGLYNAMTAPCHNMTIAGIVWYQGESNAELPYDYFELTRRQIEGYRRAWKEPELPYYFVQLPNFTIDLANPEAWAGIRDVQRRCLSIPGTGMVTAIDAGEDNDLHPLNKKTIGERLSMLVLARQYGIDCEFTGPVPAEPVAYEEDGKTFIRLELTHADNVSVHPYSPEGNLEIRDFDAVDENGAVLVPEEIKLIQKTGGEAEIRLIFAAGWKLQSLRYVYGNTNRGALIYNGAGLPMSPFILELKDWSSLWLGYHPAGDYEGKEETKEILRRVRIEGFDENSAVVRNAIRELSDGLAGMLEIRPFVYLQDSSGTKFRGLILRRVPTGSSENGQGRAQESGAELLPEGYRFQYIDGSLTGEQKAPQLILEASDESGLLYGVFALLRALALKRHLRSLEGVIIPDNPLRMLDHWDNMDGSIERGYSGRSFFFRDDEILTGTARDRARIRDYARFLASVGINASVINNVNVRGAAQELITDRYAKRLAVLSQIFAQYGIRLYLSVNFAAPISVGGLSSADPCLPETADWWRTAIRKLYERIPNLGGFLVKADSEGQPGPYAYGRTQADGANMLADQLRPFGGTVIWRCFVYNCTQDWRDTKTDRARAGYDHFRNLDGTFRDNVILQIKNGPMDFQIREPVSPLFGGMTRTRQMLEVQIAQEYTGQQIDLCYLIPMFREVLDFVTYLKGGTGDTVADLVSGRAIPLCRGGIAAVANTGDDRNWTGNDLAAANLYGFGRLAFTTGLGAEEIAAEWIGLTYSLSAENAKKLCDMLLSSREVYENYTSPLGIGWMVTPATHYGPSVDGYEYSRWGTYHRADHLGIGVDRTHAGTGYAQQYHEQNASRYDAPESCPEELLLFFHHLPYTYQLKSGKTLIQHIYDSHFAGAAAVEEMQKTLEGMKDELPPESYAVIRERMERQAENSREWRDQVNSYFLRKSGIPDVRGRRIY